MATIPMTDVLATERMPVDAQDIVTQARLVIVGSPGGTQEAASISAREREGEGLPLVALTPFSRPITFLYTAAAHATYGCSRSFALPEGFNPFLAPQDAPFADPSVTNLSNAGFVRDGDPETYAEGSTSTSDPVASATYLATGSWAGFKLRYSWVTDGPLDELSGRSASVQHIRYVGPTYSAGAVRMQTQRRYWVEPTDDIDTPSDSYQLQMEDARGAPLNREGDALSLQTFYSFSVFDLGPGSVRLYEFYPLILNEGLLEDVAKSNIRLPAANPARVTVRGYVAPDREHTITGWPGGDYTGQVAQHQYDLGRTVIDFEQAGAPVGLPAEAIESARERASATLAAISSANYGLKMGSRQ